MDERAWLDIALVTVYLSRADWGARPPKGTTSWPAGRPLGVACHWPGTTTQFNGRTREQVAAALRGWQAYHMDDRGWLDIAYSVAIDGAGRIWNLRGVNVRSAANGGTQPNADYLAALWVLGIGEVPTPAAVQAFRDWRRIRLLIGHPRATAVKTHNDVRPQPTACPGPDVTRLVRSGELLRAPSTQEDDVDLTKRDDAVALFNLTWRGKAPGEDLSLGVASPETPSILLNRAADQAKGARDDAAAVRRDVAALSAAVDSLAAVVNHIELKLSETPPPVSPGN